MKVNCEHCHAELELEDDVLAMKCDCGKWHKRDGSLSAHMALENAGKKRVMAMLSGEEPKEVADKLRRITNETS